MKKLSEDEILGFKLFTKMLANPAELGENEKKLVADFIASCIHNRSFNSRFNETIPTIFDINDHDIFNALAVIQEISFRTRHLHQAKDFLDKAIASYEEIKRQEKENL